MNLERFLFYTTMQRRELLDTVGLPGYPDDKGEKHQHGAEQQPEQTESSSQQQQQKDRGKEEPQPVVVVHLERPPEIVPAKHDLLLGA